MGRIRVNDPIRPRELTTIQGERITYYCFKTRDEIGEAIVELRLAELSAQRQRWNIESTLRNTRSPDSFGHAGKIRPLDWSTRNLNMTISVVSQQ